MVLFSPDLTDQNTQKQLDGVKSMIKELGGDVNHEDIWGRREMVYPIKGHEEAYYAILYFTCPNEGIEELKKDLVLEAHVLRALLSKLPEGIDVAKYIKEEKARVKELEEKEEKDRAEREKEQKKKEAKRKPAAKKTEEKDSAPAKATANKEKATTKKAAPKKDAKLSDKTLEELDDVLENI